MTSGTATDSPRPAFTAFEQRDDLTEFGANALLLFAAQLKLGFDDPESFAANSLTDGNNDKKCDLVAVTTDGQRVVVAQGYFSSTEKAEAPANKASDLNTAASWLLAGPLDALPESLRSAAEEVRQALSGGDVREFQIWYVHNLPESTNVQRELEQARQTADSIIRRDFPDAAVDVSAIEIGRATLEDEYAKTQVPILVADSFTFTIPGGFEVTSTGWSAYSTAIEAEALRALWQSHQALLMSPNIRDYLGLVKSAGNINYGIKETAKAQPENFAIFNNGITVLVHEYEVIEKADPSDSLILKVQGVGIVNGGQTTGALGSLAAGDAGNLAAAKVMARFVKCTDADVLGDIVRFNNTQNKVEATDFRSKDATQERLRREFEDVPDAEYRGGRRGGVSDAIVRRKALLPDSSVAQSLAAFHGDPNLAYNETRTIWDNDAVYSKVFRDSVSASHIVFVYGLLKAVEQAKQRIMKLPESERTEAQKKHSAFFSSRGSTYLLVAAIGSCIETVLGRAVADRYDLHFAASVSPSKATEQWQPVVDVVLAFSAQLGEATNQGLKSPEKVKKASSDFGSMVEAFRLGNPGPFHSLSAKTLPQPPGSTPTPPDEA